MYGKRQRQTAAAAAAATTTRPPPITISTTTILPERHYNNKRNESDQKQPPKYLHLPKQQHQDPDDYKQEHQQQQQQQQQIQLKSRDGKMPHRINNEHNTMDTVATTLTSPTTTIATTETTEMMMVNNNNINTAAENIRIDTSRLNDDDDYNNEDAYDGDEENDNPTMNRQQHHTTDIVQSTNRPSHSNNDVVDQNNDVEERAYKEYLRKWRESPYAIGLSYTSWKAEQAICCLPFRLFLYKYGCYDHRWCIGGEKTKQHLIRYHQQEQQNRIHQRRYHYSKNKPFIACTACCCKHTNFGRVGNMIILYETTTIPNTININHGDDDDDNPNGRRSRRNNNHHDQIRPKIRLVMGPYWMIALFVTFPIMLILSVWTGITKIPYGNVWIQVTWAFGTVVMLVSFFLVACTDPGIQYRHRTIPPTRQQQQFRNHHTINNINDDSNTQVSNSIVAAALNDNILNNQDINNDEYIWNDQALSFRIKSAKYDPECAVIIDQLDHVCPWTGTAVGKKNMCSFRIFILSVCINIIYNLLLLAVLAMDKD